MQQACRAASWISGVSFGADLISRHWCSNSYRRAVMRSVASLELRNLSAFNFSRSLATRRDDTTRHKNFTTKKISYCVASARQFVSFTLVIQGDFCLRYAPPPKPSNLFSRTKKGRPKWSNSKQTDGFETAPGREQTERLPSRG